MDIRLTKKFAKQYSKAPRKIKKAFDSRLKIFKKQPFHPVLNNHSLKGNYLYHQSINVTGDWRAIFLYSEENGNKTAIFIALGTHSQLYK